MEFSRPEYWRRYPFPSPGGLPNPGIEPRSPNLQADTLPAEPQGKPKNAGMGSLSLLQQILRPRIELGSPALQVAFYQLTYLVLLYKQFNLLIICLFSNHNAITIQASIYSV